MLCGCDGSQTTLFLENGHMNPCLLLKAELPASENLGAFPGENIVVDYSQVAAVHDFPTTFGTVTIVQHPIASKRSDEGDGGPIPIRVSAHGLPALIMKGPITLWKDNGLIMAARADTTCMVLDTGSEYGLLVVVVYDNLSLGGPVELHVLGKGRDASWAPIWLDNQCKGYQYVIARDGEVEGLAFRLALWEYSDDSIRRAGTLEKSMESGDIVFVRTERNKRGE